MSLLHLVKTAGAKGKATSTLADAAGIAGGVALASGGAIAADKAINFGGTKIMEYKAPSTIRYAIKKHPELKNVGESKLKRWLMGIYSVAPSVAKDPELAADTMYQIYQYGGNFDLATVKMLADVSRGVKHDNLGYINAGYAGAKMGRGN